MTFCPTYFSVNFRGQVWVKILKIWARWHFVPSRLERFFSLLGTIFLFFFGISSHKSAVKCQILSPIFMSILKCLSLRNRLGDILSQLFFDSNMTLGCQIFEGLLEIKLGMDQGLGFSCTQSPNQGISWPSLVFPRHGFFLDYRPRIRPRTINQTLESRKGPGFSKISSLDLSHYSCAIFLENPVRWHLIPFVFFYIFRVYRTTIECRI